MLRFVALVFVFSVAACDSTGRVQVFVAAEDTIPEGLVPGSEEEHIHDGWTVSYDKFIAVVGNFRAGRSSAPAARLAEPKAYVIDMKSLPTNGLVLATFENVAAERWDKVGYDLPNASAATLKAEVTSQADHDRMVQNGWSVYFEATLTRSDGTSCNPTAPGDCVPRPSLKVKFGLKAGTSYDGCAPPEGDAGFAVPTGGSAQVKPTLHGDHWFFTNLTQGAEITERRAQWMADADLDRDGETTIEELKRVRAADLFKSPPYNLTGAIIPLNTAHDFLEAQARTLGDFQGEGECPTRRVLP